METKSFCNLAKRHLTFTTEEIECCICWNPTDKRTKQCNHPICLECFYKLRETNKDNVCCPMCRCLLINGKNERFHNPNQRTLHITRIGQHRMINGQMFRFSFIELVG
jgi:hypothetical protein